MRRLPYVDRVAVDERAATLGRRSIKHEAKLAGIRLAISTIDLTTLEGHDTLGKVRALAAKAVCPAPLVPEVPSCLALCVYPTLIPSARKALTDLLMQYVKTRTGHHGRGEDFSRE